MFLCQGCIHQPLFLGTKLLPALGYLKATPEPHTPIWIVISSVVSSIGGILGDVSNQWAPLLQFLWEVGNSPFLASAQWEPEVAISGLHQLTTHLRGSSSRKTRGERWLVSFLYISVCVVVLRLDFDPGWRRPGSLPSIPVEPNPSRSQWFRIECSWCMVPRVGGPFLGPPLSPHL